MIEYKGLKHYPLGDATLELNGDNLVLNANSDIGDGLTVDIAEYSDWELKFDNHELSNNQSINTSLIGVDGFNRIKTIGQTSIFINQEGRGSLAVNSKLMGKTIKMIAVKNGEIVFQEEYDNPSYCQNDPIDSAENWIYIAIAIATLIVTAVDYKVEKTYDANGNLTQTKTTKSFGIAGIAFQGRCGDEFNADHIYVESSFNYNPSLNPIFVNTPNQVQFMCNGINEIVIHDEVYS